jgi:hypothetical protein
MRRDPGAAADIAELSIALIVIKHMSNSRKGIGVTITAFLDRFGTAPAATGIALPKAAP